MTEETHEYLSTSCWHGRHAYCNSASGVDIEGNQFARKPGVCKFCDAPCTCRCHQEQ